MTTETSGIWRSTITELIGIFRESLEALIPAMEKARIPWREGEAYDDWDEIANTLFKSIVINSLAEELSGALHLSEYDVHYEDYSKRSFLQVATDSGDRTAFVKFAMVDRPFDSIYAVALNDALLRSKELILPSTHMKIQLCLNTGDKLVVKDDFRVML